MKRVELLAPAGSYESFLGAIHAGADAVYLGGAKFGARAYADNFTEEEVCSAVRYAHVYGRKVYLTLNTLVKTREFEEIYDYLLPFYRVGLDGVIIQDIGVFQAVGEWFPGLERHVSTQMNITGARGALLLKELGAERIVPARELSLEEIKEIKKAADIEIETFVHGAVCYCYSGQCLFSSIIGGRSGNRGRCAQPCRLPYKIEGDKEEAYPLSLKDMCTIEMLPELVEAGIDSFKIEGRMKSPEYAAGVTALYRKYMDQYYRNPSGSYRVEKSDMEKLRALYIRSEISEGYYHRHNGWEMLTLDSPAYAGRDEALAGQIRKEYLEGDFRLFVMAKAILKKDSPASLILRYEREAADTTIGKGAAIIEEITAKGEMVQMAQKQPLSEEAVRRQLAKSGNTVFRMEQITIEMDKDVFLPVKALNDLRRIACEKLEESIIHGYELDYPCREDISVGKKENRIKEGNITAKKEKTCGYRKEERNRREEKQSKNIQKGRRDSIHISALTKEQCISAVKGKVKRLYVSSDLCSEEAWMIELKKQCGEDTKLYLSLPYIIRLRDTEFLGEMKRLLQDTIFDGVLVRNLEELYWIVKTFGTQWEKQIVSDAGLYIWNPKTAAFFGEYGQEHYLPYELNLHEIWELTEAAIEKEWAATVYGRIPMMVTANCIVQTGVGCQSRKERKRMVFCRLTDRYQKDFPVFTDCAHCYNVIYNSLPLSLHQSIEKMKNTGIHTFRLDFTTEIGNDVDRIFRYFMELVQGSEGFPPYKEYTKGHWKRGVE